MHYTENFTQASLQTTAYGICLKNSILEYWTKENKKYKREKKNQCFNTKRKWHCVVPYQNPRYPSFTGEILWQRINLQPHTKKNALSYVKLTVRDKSQMMTRKTFKKNYSWCPQLALLYLIF